MRRREFLQTAVALTAGAGVSGAQAAARPTWPGVEVYKNPSCGCCTAWVAHMRAAGFTVKVVNVDDTTAARQRAGLPDRYGSCHTAFVDGYALEGHVPADEVKRLLTVRPVAVGLAVPSMPPGSPGMEVGDRHDPYQVLLIDRQGRATVFASYPKG